VRRDHVSGSRLPKLEAMQSYFIAHSHTQSLNSQLSSLLKRVAASEWANMAASACSADAEHALLLGSMFLVVVSEYQAWITGKRSRFHVSNNAASLIMLRSDLLDFIRTATAVVEMLKLLLARLSTRVMSPRIAVVHSSMTAALASLQGLQESLGTCITCVAVRATRECWDTTMPDWEHVSDSTLVNESSPINVCQRFTLNMYVSCLSTSFHV
jgi:hypothetical protein